MSNFFFFFKYRVRNPFTRNPKYRVILPNRTEISDPHVPIFLTRQQKARVRSSKTLGPPHTRFYISTHILSHPAKCASLSRISKKRHRFTVPPPNLKSPKTKPPLSDFLEKIYLRENLGFHSQTLSLSHTQI